MTTDSPSSKTQRLDGLPPFRLLATADAVPTAASASSLTFSLANSHSPRILRLSASADASLHPASAGVYPGLQIPGAGVQPASWHRLALARLIVFYQRHLSPRKGFSCAWRVIHGGPSCSEAVKAIVLEHGPVGGWEQIRERFRACSEAARTLRNDKDRRSQRSSASNSTCDRWSSGADGCGCLADLIRIDRLMPESCSGIDGCDCTPW